MQNFVPKVTVPRASNAIDQIINSLVDAWNQQDHGDQAAQRFFGPCLFGERDSLITDSIYRWDSETDRMFVATWLYEFARAIYAGTFRWNP